MTPTLIDTPKPPTPSSAERAVHAVGRAAHAVHEAGVLKTAAADAVEDGLHAARRAVVRGVHKIENLGDDAAYRVRRAPLASIALAAGTGVLVGIALGCVGRCSSKGSTVQRSAPEQ